MAKRTNEELLFMTKMYDFILWSCNHTGKFPRNHRFVPGERLERSLYDVLELLIIDAANHRVTGRGVVPLCHSKVRDPRRAVSRLI